MALVAPVDPDHPLRECSVDGCTNRLIDHHPRRKYCPDHADTTPPKVRCAKPGCRKPVSKKSKNGYCSPAHAAWRKQLEREQRRLDRKVERMANQVVEETAELMDDADVRRTRQEKVYRLLIANGYDRRILEGDITQKQAAEMLAVSEAAVSRAMAAVHRQGTLDDLEAEFAMDPTVAAMFPVEMFGELAAIGYDQRGTPAFERVLERLVEAFLCFQHTYMTIRGIHKMIIEPFHIRWIRRMMLTFIFGRKAAAVSPPRHGKSELLIRWCVWRIVMFPNIRIMWIGATTPLAKIMVRSVKAHLEFNEQLIADTLPKGKFYKPGPRDSGGQWDKQEIIVATRTSIGDKSPTLIALGRTATIPGRDVDDLIEDDMEDFDSTRGVDGRLYGKQKHGEIMERKELHTGVFVIGSRQHPEDVVSGLETQDEWDIIVDAAHDEDCGHDPDDFSLHHDCVLLPQVRPYHYLMSQKAEYEKQGLYGRYELRYLNAPVPTEGIIFDVEVIRDKACDRSRGVGLLELPPGTLIAGLDPTPRGQQAAFCWSWTPETLYMVDLETQEAGGFAGAIDVAKRWHQAYGLTVWVYEDNSQQIEFFRDPRVDELRHTYGIQFLPHTTGKNKHDKELGLSSMAPLYHTGGINLPYGTSEARKKTGILLRQLQLWSPSEGRQPKYKTDVRMASWFPFPRIQQMESSADGVEVVLDYTDGYMGASYGDIDTGFTEGMY